MYDLVNATGRLVFAARDDDHGFELWRSLGTAASTQRVKDIRPGPGDSDPTLFVRRGGHVYFRADDGVHGKELWKSDGTAAGTKLLKDVNSQP